MQSNIQIIEALVSKKEELLSIRDEMTSKIEKLDEIIALFKGGSPAPIIPASSSEANRTSSIEYVQGTIFPPTMPLEEQVVEAFKNFGQVMKLQVFASELKKISKTSRTEGGISNFVRDLKKQGKVVSIKFNGSLSYSYWGLPYMIPKEEGSIKDLSIYAPVSEELPDNSTYELVQ